MPNIRTFDAGPGELQPSDKGSAAFRELGAVQERNALQAERLLTQTGRQIGRGIGEIGQAVGSIEEKAQQHTDTAAWLEGMKDGTANDLAAFDTIEGIGTKRTDENGNPSPSTPAFATGANDLLGNYEQTLAGEREKFAASGASAKEQDRFAMHQATRLHAVMVKAHSEAHIVAAQEALGNIDKAANTVAAQVDRHPETLDDALGRIDDMVGAASGGMSKLEAQQTLGPKAVDAKGNLIAQGIFSYAKNGQLDQADRLLNDPKYDQYIGKHREVIESKVSSITQARIRDQNATDAAQEKVIGVQQDALIDRIYRNSQLPQDKQDPNLTRAALETSPLFLGRPQDMEKARKTLDSLTSNTIDPAQSKQIADGVSSGITRGTITMPAQIDAAYNGGHMTWQDRTRLQTELKDATDNPATKQFNGAINDWLKKGGEGQIDRTVGVNMGLGTVKSQLGQEMVGKWEAEVKRRAQILTSKGQDPHSLLDPNSPDSMVTPQALAPYRVTEQMETAYQAQQKAIDVTTAAKRATGQVPTGEIPVPAPLKNTPNLLRNNSTGQFYDPASKQFYNADGKPAPMTLQAPKATPAPQKMNFAPDAGQTPAQRAINSALQPMPDAHLDKNLFSSGRAAAMGVKGGIGENLTTITAQGHPVQVNAEAAPHFKGFLDELDSMGYKIKEIGGYNDRMKRGSFTSMSEHAFGNAIDINPDKNPFHTSKTNLPPNVAQIAARYGLIWGGNWSGRSRDPMHFEWSGKTGGTQTAQAP